MATLLSGAECIPAPLGGPPSVKASFAETFDPVGLNGLFSGAMLHRRSCEYLYTPEPWCVRSRQIVHGVSNGASLSAGAEDMDLGYVRRCYGISSAAGGGDLGRPLKGNTATGRINEHCLINEGTRCFRLLRSGTVRAKGDHITGGPF